MKETKEKNGAIPAWPGQRGKKGDRNGQGKGETHQNAPRRQARPTQPGRASTRTHARDPGGFGVDPKQPWCTGRGPRSTTDGTGKGTRE